MTDWLTDWETQLLGCHAQTLLIRVLPVDYPTHNLTLHGVDQYFVDAKVAGKLLFLMLKWESLEQLKFINLRDISGLYRDRRNVGKITGHGI